MISGLGTDIVRIERIADLLRQFPTRFPARILSEEESVVFQSLTGARQIAYLAKRFAAKEACAKALGLGFRQGLRFTHITTSNDAHGKPTITLARDVIACCPFLSIPHKIHLSLADDEHTAYAVVIVEQV